MYRRVRLLWIVTPLLMACCASFPAGKVGSLEPWPPPRDGEAKTVRVIFSGRMTVDGREGDLDPKGLAIARAEVVRAYQDSELFSAVVEETKEADRQAEVRFDLDGAGPPQLYLLIPWRTTETFTMTTIVRDDAARELGSVTATETIRTWYHFFMAPFMFTNLPRHVWNRATYDITRRMLIEASQQGMF